MKQRMDRIGEVVPQEIPDDPQSRIPCTVFSHPAGGMVIAPATGKDAADWRFIADTIRPARELYTAIEEGTRRHRVFKAKLLVGHEVSPAALAAFMDGLITFTAILPHVRPGSAEAAVAAIRPDGVEVELTCCLDVRTTDDERADRTALMLDVPRLADRIRIRLDGQASAAVPTLDAAAA